VASADFGEYQIPAQAVVKTAANPGGLPKEVFDGFQAQLAANR
jgi:hypothetical protein